MKELNIPVPQKFVVFYTLEKENDNRVHNYVDTAVDAIQAIEHFEIVFKNCKNMEKCYDYQIVGTLTFDYAVGLGLI